MSNTLLIRCRQSARSDRIYSIPFGQDEHKAREDDILAQLHLPKKTYFITSQPDNNKFITLNTAIELINRPHDEAANFYLNLEGNSPWFPLKIESISVSKIVVIKHEGDIEIKGDKPTCDCHNCLLEFFIENHSDYQCAFKSPNIDIAGIQYSYCIYELGKNVENTCSPSCKKLSRVITFNNFDDAYFAEPTQ